MASVKSSPRPSCVKPMRAARLRKCDPLDRWLASVTMKTTPEIFLRSPLPDDQAMCEIYISVYEVHSTALSTEQLPHPPSGPPRDHTPTYCRRISPSRRSYKRHRPRAVRGIPYERRRAVMGPSTTAAPISPLPATPRFHRETRWGNV